MPIITENQDQDQALIPARKFHWNSKTMLVAYAIIAGTAVMNFFGVELQDYLGTFNQDWENYKTGLTAFVFAVIRVVWTKGPVEGAGWQQLLEWLEKFLGGRANK